MEIISIPTTGFFARRIPFPPFSRSSLKPPFTKIPTISAFKTTSPTVREIMEDDVLEIFLKDREANGDFISKASDRIWLREFLKSVHDDNNEAPANVEPADQEAANDGENDADNGFLKLKQTQEWLIGQTNSAPMNRKAIAKEIQDERERRKKLNLLQYEAIKRELMLLSVGIGGACSGYCLLALSAQAAVSYGIGVLFSCLYLRLLYRYSDNVSKQMVPEIFMQKKTKKIGIRSEDLKDFVERTIKGSGLALSSPRLVIPAAIYAFWALSHKYLQNDLFSFEIVPAMVGLFVYKAAALVQVYRDNQDLQFIFPENEGDPMD